MQEGRRRETGGGGPHENVSSRRRVFLTEECLNEKVSSRKRVVTKRCPHKNVLLTITCLHEDKSSRKSVVTKTCATKMYHPRKCVPTKRCPHEKRILTQTHATIYAIDHRHRIGKITPTGKQKGGHIQPLTTTSPAVRISGKCSTIIDHRRSDYRRPIAVGYGQSLCYRGGEGVTCYFVYFLVVARFGEENSRRGKKLHNKKFKHATSCSSSWRISREGGV